MCRYLLWTEFLFPTSCPLPCCNSHIETLIPNVIVFEDVALDSIWIRLDYEVGNLMMRLMPLGEKTHLSLPLLCLFISG